MIGVLLVIIFILTPLILTYRYNLRKQQVRQGFSLLATALAVGNVVSAYFLGVLADHNIATPSLGIHVPVLLLFYVLLIAQIVLNYRKKDRKTNESE